MEYYLIGMDPSTHTIRTMERVHGGGEGVAIEISAIQSVLSSLPSSLCPECLDKVNKGFRVERQRIGSFDIADGPEERVEKGFGKKIIEMGKEAISFLQKSSLFTGGEYNNPVEPVNLQGDVVLHASSGGIDSFEVLRSVNNDAGDGINFTEINQLDCMTNACVESVEDSLMQFIRQHFIPETGRAIIGQDRFLLVNHTLKMEIPAHMRLFLWISLLSAHVQLLNTKEPFTVKSSLMEMAKSSKGLFDTTAQQLGEDKDSKVSDIAFKIFVRWVSDRKKNKFKEYKQMASFIVPLVAGFINSYKSLTEGDAKKIPHLEELRSLYINKVKQPLQKRGVVTSEEWCMYYLFDQCATSHNYDIAFEDSKYHTRLETIVNLIRIRDADLARKFLELFFPELMDESQGADFKSNELRLAIMEMDRSFFACTETQWPIAFIDVFALFLNKSHPFLLASYILDRQLMVESVISDGTILDYLKSDILQGIQKTPFNSYANLHLINDIFRQY